MNFLEMLLVRLYEVNNTLSNLFRMSKTWKEIEMSLSHLIFICNMDLSLVVFLACIFERSKSPDTCSTFLAFEWSLCIIFFSRELLIKIVGFVPQLMSS